MFVSYIYIERDIRICPSVRTGVSFSIGNRLEDTEVVSLCDGTDKRVILKCAVFYVITNAPTVDLCRVFDTIIIFT